MKKMNNKNNKELLASKQLSILLGKLNRLLDNFDILCSQMPDEQLTFENVSKYFTKSIEKYIDDYYLSVGEMSQSDYDFFWDKENKVNETVI